MKYYQDLLDCGKDEEKRAQFILSAIEDHKRSDAYKMAADAELYYRGLNPTINRYEKIIYDLRGMAHRDMWTANHKIASSFFRFAVDQGNSYLLGNGVTFGSEETKASLGTLAQPFDAQIYDAGRAALIGGVSFGFWNLDHLDIFPITEFVPLYSEETGALMAGIRWWQIDSSRPLRATLYEIGGYTEYTRPRDDKFQIMQKRRAYIIHTIATDLMGTEIVDGENYPTLPIVPLKNNKWSESELAGKRNTVDALDLVTSSMVNNVNEGNLIYWVLKGAGGMDEVDDAKFLERIISSKVAHVDDGIEVDAHTLEAPIVSTQTAIDELKRKLYEDFQAFDASAVTAGNQTATAIQASYIPLDLKTDKFEMQVTRFIGGVLELAGIEDKPSYTRSQLINKTEETQNIMTAAELYDEEYVIKKLLTINGDIDQYEEMMQRKAAEESGRYKAPPIAGSDGSDGREIANAKEAVDAAEEAVGKTLNGSQTASLITVIRQFGAGTITEGQAVNILMTSIGVTREEALRIIRGEE